MQDSHSSSCSHSFLLLLSFICPLPDLFSWSKPYAWQRGLRDRAHSCFPSLAPGGPPAFPAQIQGTPSGGEPVGFPFILLIKPGDEIKWSEACTCTSNRPFHWNLIELTDETLRFYDWGAQSRPYLLCVAFPDIASTFECLFLCRKVLNIRLFNKNSFWRSHCILGASCHFRDQQCSFSARSLI